MKPRWLTLKSDEHRKLLSNVQNLFVVQATNYILPLLVIPYIVRTIGPEKFGILSFVQTIIHYLLMVAEYGFDITGTQILAKEHKNPQRRDEIFSLITTIKFLLMAATAILLFLLVLFVPAVAAYGRIYWLYFLMLPGMLLFSNWFFIGMEEMRYLNYPNILSKLGYAACVFFFLHNEGDYFMVPLFYSAFVIFGGLLSLLIILNKFGVRYIRPSWKQIIAGLRDGWSIFVSTFAINLYRRSNIFVLGLVASKEAVGYYSAGEKIVKALQSTFVPVTQAFYPFISRKMTAHHSTNSIKAIKKLALILGSLTALLSIAIIIVAAPLMTLFAGERFLHSIPVLRIGSFVICLGVLNFIAGIIFMTNAGLKKEFSVAVIVTGLINILLCYCLATWFQETGAAISFLLSELLLLIILLVQIRFNRAKWSPSVS